MFITNHPIASPYRSLWLSDFEIYETSSIKFFTSTGRAFLFDFFAENVACARGSYFLLLFIVQILCPAAKLLIY